MSTPGQGVAFPALIESLYPSLEFVLSCAGDCGVDETRRHDIELAMEEILVNIYDYAYPESPGEVSITCGRTAGKKGNIFTIEIADGGVPFDILSVSEPDLDADIEERPIGRLGVFVVKKLMDGVHYRHEKGLNIVTIEISLDKPRPSFV